MRGRSIPTRLQRNNRCEMKNISNLTKCQYKHIHEWIKRHKGKANKCSIDDSHIGIYQWANISGYYYKDFNDWIMLCKKCHSIFDAKNLTIDQLRQRINSIKNNKENLIQYEGLKFNYSCKRKLNRYQLGILRGNYLLNNLIWKGVFSQWQKQI